MHNIDFSIDSDIEIQNKLFNNIQICRVDVTLAKVHGKFVDEDTIKVAQALAREIQGLSKLHTEV